MEVRLVRMMVSCCTGRFTFGEKVQGTVRLKATLTSSR